MKTVSLSDRRLSLKFADIRTGNKCLFARASDNDHADGVISTHFIESRDALHVDLGAKSVEFVGTIDGQDRDLTAMFNSDGFVHKKQLECKL